MYFCSVWHSAHVATWALGMRWVCCTMGCAVSLVWSWVVWTWDQAVLGMLTRYPCRALCVQRDSARIWSTVSYGSDTWGQWGLILTKLVNGCELNFGAFRSLWIWEMLNVCFSFFLTEFVIVVASGGWEAVCMYSMSEVPLNGGNTSGILLLLLFIIYY